MNRRSFMKICGMGVATAVLPMSPAAAADKKRKPNFIFILADDLGWNELGCFGNKFNETPNLDKLAKQGMLFTNAYAASTVCSPSRSGLLSGQYPVRCGITNYLYPRATNHLPKDKITLAQVFKANGYVTGMCGKWHQSGYVAAGLKPSQVYMPEEAGFDEVLISEKVGIADGSYFHPYNRVSKAIKPHAKTPKYNGKEFLTDRLNIEAVEFIERHKARPFFFYKSHYAVHTALAAPARTVEHFSKKPGAGKPIRGGRRKGKVKVKNNPLMAAMVKHIDDGVGMIMDKLDRLGLAGNTVVVFTSDNGGQAGGTRAVTDISPLREGKSFTYEGGIREPLIIRWAGISKPASTCRTTTVNLDFYPTFVEIGGLKTEANYKLDGVSIVPLLEGGKIRRDAIFQHYPHGHFLGAKPSGAVIRGDYKLIEFFNPHKYELYNLADDIGETKDLAPRMPEKAAELAGRLHAWRKDVGAARPKGRKQDRTPGL